MKKIVLKMAFIGLCCASAMNAWALTPSSFGNLPLFFEVVPAPADHPAQFVACGADCQFLISPAQVQCELRKTAPDTKEAFLRTVRMQFVGAASEARINGANELPGKINYLIGKNPAGWRTDLATFARVRVKQLYRGINLVYYGNQQKLEYDFTIAPGANPDAIKIHFVGVDKISIGAQGELILVVGQNEIRQPAPVIYQTIHGQRRAVPGGYRLVDAHTVAFTVGGYNQNLSLVIDPVLNFSTYFGGSGDDSAHSIALGKNGSIYITGQTMSGGLATSNVFQKDFAGGSLFGDAFVAKFDNEGSNLVYFTYLGGAADDQGNGIAVDSAGDAFVTGFTDSANFPTTTNALYRSISGTPTPVGYTVDAFAAEISPGGSNLVYSTYLGGSGPDVGTAIALDSANNIYLAGYTCSTNFPTTTNAIQKHLACPYSIYTFYQYANAFLTEISASGTNLLYCSYLGGANFDAAESIAIDSSNDVYVAGLTDSTNFPTKNAFQPNFGGSVNPISTYDAFVAKFAPTSTNLSLLYSSFLGGINTDLGYAIAADTNGNAYVVGATASPDFPNTATNVPGLYNGQNNNLVYGYGVTTNAFLTQITWNGTNAAIGYSTVFGGTNFGSDIGYGVALDRYGNVYVVGSSSTANFPAFNTPGLMQPTNAGYSDAFVTAFRPNVSSLIYSGYLGGSGDDFGYGIAVDSSTNVYIAGQTASADFPTFSPYQSSLKGGSDAFLAKIGWVNDPPVITTQPTNQAVTTGTKVTFVTTVTGTPPLTYQWQELGTNSTWTNLVDSGNISTTTNATLTISNAQVTNSGSYRLYVANTAGSTTSSKADLTVTNVLPVITDQPVSETIEVGAASVRGYIFFSVTNSLGTLPENYQWVKDGTNLVNGGTNVSSQYQFHIYGATNSNGGTNAALFIVDPQTDDQGTYWLVITNPAGVVVSSNATLTVTEAPIITKQPTNQTVGLGSTVNFAVTAVGTGTLSYQWQYDGADLTDGTNASGSIISSSTNATMTLQNAQTNDDGGYTVIVTNDFGSVTSAPPAVLTVLTVPTFTSITMGTNGDMAFSGAGGTNGGGYIVYASTNLALPLNQWRAISVNGSQFGSQGQFSFTNTPPAGTPQRFYILELPPP